VSLLVYLTRCLHRLIRLDPDIILVFLTTHSVPVDEGEESTAYQPGSIWFRAGGSASTKDAVSWIFTDGLLDYLGGKAHCIMPLVCGSTFTVKESLDGWKEIAQT
jgi:hypothetical protein